MIGMSIGGGAPPTVLCFCSNMFHRFETVFTGVLLVNS